MASNRSVRMLTGIVTIGILLFGAVTLFLEGRAGGGKGMAIPALLFVFAIVRTVLLVRDIQWQRRRDQRG